MSIRSGTVVKVNNSIGIVLEQKNNVLRVLFDDYRVLYVNKNLASKTGKYFDLSIIWDVVK